MSRMRTVSQVYRDAMREPEPAQGSGRVHISNYVDGDEARRRGDHLVPVVRGLDALIVDRVLDVDDRAGLDMRGWHCGSAHCRGGWATTVGGPRARALELALNAMAAAALIYYESCGWIPDFSANQRRFETELWNYDPEEMALADMLAGAALDPIPLRRKVRPTPATRV